MKAVIFDLDGTLVDSAPDIALSMNRLLADHGVPPQKVSFVEGFIGEGARALVAKLFAALDVKTNDLDRDVAAYIDYYRANPVEASKLYADAGPALQALHGAGIKLGVCTNKLQELAEIVLGHFGLLPLMSVVIGADTTPYTKPDPRPLLHAAEALGVEPHEVVYVGDTTIDRDCATAAKVPYRIVNWGTGRDVKVAEEARLAQFADLLPNTVAAD
ncbi:phosphoglycolate phosphatase [Labrys miyagiensis]|uniref:phosphoglycolate phosphatase n=1 Tax=Labrys miyagiensis TaxID=346912 RepID=A0ABQ6CKR3_9HYPH|nr:HAD-IA family hydrolase [Labrys miyagiensis]GLS20878.1 phosphoglycolate phosphatase [Labrys miyagiensis]